MKLNCHPGHIAQFVTLLGGASRCTRFRKGKLNLKYKAICVSFRRVEQMTCHKLLFKVRKFREVQRSRAELDTHFHFLLGDLEFLSHLK